MKARDAALPAALLDLLVDCTVAAVVAELRERGNPLGDSTDRTDAACDDADFSREGLGRPA